MLVLNAIMILRVLRMSHLRATRTDLSRVRRPGGGLLLYRRTGQRAKMDVVTSLIETIQ